MYHVPLFPKPFEGNAETPKDSSDSTKETNGQGTIYGPNKKGGTVPYNNPEGAENIRTGMDAMGAVKNGIDCFHNANHQ